MFGKKKDEAPIEAVQPVEEVKEETEVVEAPVISGKTVIGQGAKFTGDFESENAIEICGELEGNILSAADVCISKTGKMYGNGKVDNITVEGIVEGDIECKGTTHIAPTGKLSGSLLTARLLTDDGSSFEGNLEMITGKAQKKA